MSKPQVILIPRQLPEEVLVFLADFLVTIGENVVLFSHCFEVEQGFASLDIVHSDSSKKSWKVKLPLHFVLAVADVGEEQKKKIGFV